MVDFAFPDHIEKEGVSINKKDNNKEKRTAMMSIDSLCQCPR